MSTFANGREVSGKAQPNKIIAAFPSVCLSPPSPPAGPLPIPYPMFTDASKTASGTKTVKVKKKEAGKANKSTYKSSKGNEPATRSFGMDVVTHQLSKSTVHQAYSFDVKFENKGAIRFMDMSTTNHASPQAPATAITMNVASLSPPMPAPPDKDLCKELSQANKDSRDELGNRKYAKTRKLKNGNNTVTNAQYTPVNGTPQRMRACSNAAALDEQNTWAKGKELTANEAKDAKAGKPVESDVCKGSDATNHEYKVADKMSRPHTAHTESRLLEDITANNPPGEGGNMGQIVMSIDWNANENVIGDDGKALREMKGGKNTFVRRQVSKKVPCQHCKKLLCQATKCMKVYLCDKKNKPQDFSKQCP